MAYIDVEYDRGTLIGTVLEMGAGPGGTTPQNYHKFATIKANVNGTDSSTGNPNSWRISVPMNIFWGNELYPGFLAFSDYVGSNFARPQLAGYLAGGYYNSSLRNNQDIMVVFKRSENYQLYYDFYLKAVNKYWEKVKAFIDLNGAWYDELTTYRAYHGEQGVASPSGTQVACVKDSIASGAIVVYGTLPT